MSACVNKRRCRCSFQIESLEDVLKTGQGHLACLRPGSPHDHFPATGRASTRPRIPALSHDGAESSVRSGGGPGFAFFSSVAHDTRGCLRLRLFLFGKQRGVFRFHLCWMKNASMVHLCLPTHGSVFDPSPADCGPKEACSRHTCSGSGLERERNRGRNRKRSWRLRKERSR